MLRRNLLFIAAVLIPYSTASAQMRTTLSAPFDLAISGTPGQYIVETMINGQGPYKLILDTGTSAIALDLGLVKDLGLQKTGDRTENMPFNTKMQIPVYGADSLRVGNLLLNDVHF